jgi:iron complex transport system permease protein
MTASRGTGWVLAGLGLLLILAAAGLPFVGLEPLPWREVWQFSGSRPGMIFWQLRVPRVLAGVFSGAALAVAGLTFQALFRNPLATPFTLGTASGASLGASLYLWTGWSFSLLGVSGLTLFAFLGALLALGLVYGFSRLRGGFPAETMLLAGVASGFLFSSLILLLQYLANQAHSLRILRWLMGGLDVVGFGQVLEPLPFILAGAAVIGLKRYDLNLLSVGEDLAAGRGVDVNRTKLLLILAVGLMVGAVVSVAGPVGFVGIMVPHVCRLLLGPDHRALIPASLLLGGVFLPACDAVARIIVAPAELPVGIITALLGGPFFLWLLLSRKSKS